MPRCNYPFQVNNNWEHIKDKSPGHERETYRLTLINQEIELAL